MCETFPVAARFAKRSLKMQELIERFDAIAGISEGSLTARVLDRTAFVCLILMIVSAPHSIAASQGTFLLGIVASFFRLFASPKRRLVGTPLNWLFLLFFIWSVITVVFSYDLAVSASKLRGVTLFFVFFFVVNNLRSFRSLRFLALALILSTMVNVLWTPVERIIGRGVEIHGIRESSPLKKALLWEGDTLLRVNGEKVKTPEDVLQKLKSAEESSVEFYRPDFYFTVKVKRSDLLEGTALEQLGINSWKKSRNWRSQGFFNHYVTYAEVLQLIISFVLGLFIAGLSGSNFKKLSFLPFSPLLLFCLAAMSFALLLTVTRASQLAFLVSAASIVILNGNKKLIVAMLLSAVPVALIGLYFLQQSREVGFFDSSDTSISYRVQVYREGVDLWLDNPKHFFLGVGMDMNTKKDFVRKWGLFDNGKLPVGHFHSTPIQLLAERGLFALFIWIAIAGVYLMTLWRAWKELRKRTETVDPIDFPRSFHLSRLNWQRGIILGCFGAAVGFFTSSLVHYNLGDGEVALVFYMLMGFGVFAAKMKVDQAARSIP